jgi:hydroxypyruvate reductase
MTPRSLLTRLYRAALEGADPEAAVRRTLTRPEIVRALSAARSVGIFASGKAGAAMARGARHLRASRTLVVLPRGYPLGGLDRASVVFSSHPEPDRSSVHAARRAIEFFRGFGPGDVIVCLVSGGTSALVALPRPGLSLGAKRRAVRELARSGASILELNRLRTSLSAVKGGRLGRATGARLITLVLSDVPGDRAAAVGSGPTVRGRRGDLVRVIGSNRDGLDAAERVARRLGFRVERPGRRLSGEARGEGRRLARRARDLRPSTVLLAGGEPVVKLSGRQSGRGGRSLELALGAAGEIALTGIALLAAVSDGIDGSSGAAGAFVDGGTLARAALRGADAERALTTHDSLGFFRRAGGLLVTGPTGGNVGDWVFLARNRDWPGPV